MNDLPATFNRLEGKMHYLGILSQKGKLDIGDPYGLPLESFLACYRRIERSLKDAL